MQATSRSIRDMQDTSRSTINMANPLNQTLEQFMTMADETEEFIHKYAIGVNLKTLEEKILQLQSNIKTIQVVALRLANVSNVCTKIKRARSKIEDVPKYIDPYPKTGDHTILRTAFPKDTQQITKRIRLPIVRVEQLEDIPMHPLYYIEQYKQFAINVNGIILRGNIGNLEEYQGHKTARCEYGAQCTSINNCKYYHDPTDYKKDIVPQTRNFTVGSFIYTRNLNPKTYYARHVGSLDTLEQDISKLKTRQFRDEMNTRQDQLMHDLLILLVLHSLGYLEEYPHWLL